MSRLFWSRFSSVKSKILFSGLFFGAAVYADDFYQSNFITKKKGQAFAWGAVMKTNLPVEISQEVVGKNIHDIAFGPDYLVVLGDAGLFVRTVKEGIVKWNDVTFFKGQKIKQISCSPECFYVLNESGKLFSVKLGETFASSYSPILTSITKVAAGNHVAALTFDGHVLTKGRNSFGQCGQKQESEYIDEFFNVFTSNDVLTISELPFPTIKRKPLSKESSIPLSAYIPVTHNTKISSNSDEIVTVPLPPVSTDPVVDVAVGSDHTLFVTKSGSVYACGDDSKCQLGQPEPWKGYAYRTIPSKISFFEGLKAVQAVAGENHSAILVRTENRTDVITWGQGLYGQLGIGSSVHIGFPKLIEALHGLKFYHDESKKEHPLNVISLASGDNHMIALLKDGTAFTWGLNKNGQIGNGRRANVSSPLFIKNGDQSMHAVKVTAAYQSTGALL